MPFEGTEADTGVPRVSPGGFEFGIQGWSYGAPLPRSITFFLDNTAVVTDQYGRVIRRALLPDGREVRFADGPPEGNKEGTVTPRPQFATHAQVIASLEAEHIDWQGYQVDYIQASGGRRTVGGLTQEKAVETQRKLIEGGCRNVVILRTIVYAGWPQLPYEALKLLRELPNTPLEELLKIADKTLRDAAFKVLGLQVESAVPSQARVLPPGVVPIPT